MHSNQVELHSRLVDTANPYIKVYSEFCMFIFEKVMEFLDQIIVPFCRGSGFICSRALRDLRITYNYQIKSVSEFSNDSRMGNRPVGTSFWNIYFFEQPYIVVSCMYIANKIVWILQLSVML